MSAARSIDRLAVRLAKAEPDFYDPGGPPRGRADAALESAARVLGSPLTRRRAVALAGATVVAGSLLRPGSARAQNCWPGGPKICEMNGRRVCVSNDLACCSNENCAIACSYPWRDCEAPAVCSDTARMCTHPAAGYSRRQTLFCSQRVRVTNGCVEGGSSEATRGWCCDPATEQCGSEFGTCECAEANKCGNDCCDRNEECVSLGLLRGKACLTPCNPGWHHEGYDCVCDHGRPTCGIRCCGVGLECIGNRCVKPAPTKLPDIFDSFKNFFDMAGQSSAAHGGARQQSIVAAQATGPVGAALLAMAAVNGLGVAAGDAFAETNVDGRYRRRVTTPRPSPPRIAGGEGLDPTAARALEQLLAAQAKGFALALACATSLARARGALRKRDMRRARKHVLAAAGFAGKAARALRPVPRLRSRAVAALRTTGAAEVVATPEQVARMQADVRAGGVPADLRAQLRRLGVRSRADLAAVRDALLAQTTGGPALIEPLVDSARTRNLKAMTAELARYSRSARRRPIARTRGGPKRYRP